MSEERGRRLFLTSSHVSSSMTSSSSRSSWQNPTTSVMMNRPVWLEHSKRRGWYCVICSWNLPQPWQGRKKQHRWKSFPPGSLKLLCMALKEGVERGSTHLKAWKSALPVIRGFSDHLNDFQR